MPYAEAAAGFIFQRVHGGGEAPELLQREALLRLVRDGEVREDARRFKAGEPQQLTHAVQLPLA